MPMFAQKYEKVLKYKTFQWINILSLKYYRVLSYETQAVNVIARNASVPLYTVNLRKFKPFEPL